MQGIVNATVTSPRVSLGNGVGTMLPPFALGAVVWSVAHVFLSLVGWVGSLSSLGLVIIGWWFDQVGGRAGSALDKLMKYGSKRKISLLMALGNVNEFEINKVRDLRVGERCENKGESECEKVHTGEFKSTTG